MSSRAGYFLAPIPLAIGLCIMGWLVWTAIGDIQKALTRVVVPGTSVLTLDAPGTYTIFHEAESVVDGKLYSAQAVPGLRVTVTSEADGKSIPVVTPAMSSSYTVGSHSGKSMFAFEMAAPAEVRVAASYAAGQTGPQTVLAIGRSFIGRLVVTIIGAVFAVLTGFGAALALFLTTYFRRRRLAPYAVR